MKGRIWLFHQLILQVPSALCEMLTWLCQHAPKACVFKPGMAA
jgi:hypothetical protein